MPIASSAEQPSAIIDQETAKTLGPRATEEINRLVTGCGERIRVSLAPQPGREGREDSVHSSERRPAYGMNVEECEADQFRGEAAGTVWE